MGIQKNINSGKLNVFNLGDRNILHTQTPGIPMAHCQNINVSNAEVLFDLTLPHLAANIAGNKIKACNYTIETDQPIIIGASSATLTNTHSATSTFAYGGRISEGITTIEWALSKLKMLRAGSSSASVNITANVAANDDGNLTI